MAVVLLPLDQTKKDQWTLWLCETDGSSRYRTGFGGEFILWILRCFIICL